MILTIVWLLLVASAFILYPFVVRQSSENESVSATRQQANVRLFKEQQAQFLQQMERSEIDQAECQRLVADAQQLLLRNTEVESGETSVVIRQGLWLVPVLLLLMSSATFYSYQKLGAEQDEHIQYLMSLGAEKTADELAAVWSSELTAAIEKRVQQRPDNIYYWAMLAQSAIAKGDLLAASDYFASAIEVEPNDSFLLAQYAEAIFLVDGSRFTERVTSALDRAFAADSSNSAVLGLKGIQAFENSQYQLAITYWEGARQGLDPASPTWQALQAGIDRVNQVLSALDDSAEQPNSATQVKLAVSISPDITFTPDQLVFVAAIRESGPPMPLAARKLRAGDLPINITLSDKDALMAGQNWICHSRVWGLGGAL
jgi:cytochrome c-type biogenesis protein CcmH